MLFESNKIVLLFSIYSTFVARNNSLDVISMGVDTKNCKEKH